MIDFKQFRRANNLTQQDAAEYFEVSQAFISQIERDERSIPPIFISKIKADEIYLLPDMSPPINNTDSTFASILTC